MLPLRTGILLMIIGCSLVGCTSPSPEDPAQPIPSKLLDGLWVAQSAKESSTAWLIDTSQKTIMPIEDYIYNVFYDLKLDPDANWIAPTFRKNFTIKEQSPQLIIMTETGTTVLERVVEKTIFNQQVDSLEDLNYLFRDTGIWKAKNSMQTIVFYPPACSWTLEKKYQRFTKEALVVEVDVEGIESPSDYRQWIKFYFHNGILCLFLKGSGGQKRYAVVKIQPNQWTLRSLAPPYPTVIWERLEKLSPSLKKFVNIHEKRLQKEREEVQRYLKYKQEYPEDDILLDPCYYTKAI